MATMDVLHSPSHFSSSPSVDEDDIDVRVSGFERGRENGEGDGADQISVLALLVAVFRKSLVACKSDKDEIGGIEIGWPTNVRHVAHVTFDRFNGFLGLPVEFEPEVPTRPPSASTSVFGVSTESMQLSYDSRGNSVPTILILMQRHLYAQGGLQAEGIFRINGENSQEVYIRDQLNRGIVPEGTDIHCLAGLIKAWFRELPTGILDSLAPEQVMQCQSEDECAQLVRQLPPTEAALLDWALNLMADVVQMEHVNKMNAHNIAMVFAPNMTQMSDPLTALMYAVQVMNFLKLLILRTLKDREDFVVEPEPESRLEPLDENDHQSPPQLYLEDTASDSEDSEKSFVTDNPDLDSSGSVGINLDADINCERICHYDLLVNNPPNLEEKTACDMSNQYDNPIDKAADQNDSNNYIRSHADSGKRIFKPFTQPSLQKNRVHGARPVGKYQKVSNLSRINYSSERIEAWR